MGNNPNQVSKALHRQLVEQVGRARESELRTALGDLAGYFDRWRTGEIDVEALDQAVHAYHNGVARAIWRRYDGTDLELTLARAIALGIITRESLPPEVLDHVAGLADFLASQRAADD
jgi:hypothetical protein